MILSYRYGEEDVGKRSWEKTYSNRVNPTSMVQSNRVGTDSEKSSKNTDKST